MSTLSFRAAELAHIAAGGSPRTTFRAHLRTRVGSWAHGVITGRTYWHYLEFGSLGAFRVASAK